MSLTLGELLCAAERKETAGIDSEDEDSVEMVLIENSEKKMMLINSSPDLAPSRQKLGKSPVSFQ